MPSQLYKTNFPGQADGTSRTEFELLRMASYAEWAGGEFRLVSPRPSIVKIMQLTGLDRRFLVSASLVRLDLK